MHTSKYVTNAPTKSLDQPTSQHLPNASVVADAASIELTQRREETRKYVERVNRYFARADMPRRSFGEMVD